MRYCGSFFIYKSYKKIELEIENLKFLSFYIRKQIGSFSRILIFSPIFLKKLQIAERPTIPHFEALLVQL